VRSEQAREMLVYPTADIHDRTGVAGGRLNTRGPVNPQFQALIDILGV